MLSSRLLQLLTSELSFFDVINATDVIFSASHKEMRRVIKLPIFLFALVRLLIVYCGAVDLLI